MHQDNDLPGAPAERVSSPLLSVSDVQAAKLLGISRAGLHRFVRKGLIPKPFKLGRRSLYRVADLRNCVDRLATP